eukprot:9443761-Lingulodinium_polyedra.AAC.1
MSAVRHHRSSSSRPFVSLARSRGMGARQPGGPRGARSDQARAHVDQRYTLLVLAQLPAEPGWHGL